MARIFWDTTHYIYLFEGHSEFGPPVRTLRQTMLRRGDQLITSTMTLGEVQVKALRANDKTEAARFRQAVLASSMVVSFDEEAAESFALVRTLTRAKGADAIQLACAMRVGVDFFLSNDSYLQSLKLPGIGEIINWNAALLGG